MSRALQQLMQALREPVVEQARHQLEQALTDLGDITVQPADPATTRTPLRVAEVSDYDYYFGLQHVHTTSDARCLVKGLLMTCHVFLTLCSQVAEFRLEHIEQQKQGFRSYVSLLIRVFHLTEQDLT